MSSIDEVKKLEEKMIQAELGPDPDFFAKYLDDNALLDGQQLKSKVVEAHRPGGPQPKFTKVEMSGYEYIDHGQAVVVKCKGTYESSKWSGSLNFMRVWLKKENGWQIIAGTTAGN